MNTIPNFCLNCEGETANAKFCSRSCSSSYNNRIAPKRVAVKRYCICGIEVFGRRTRCNDCNPQYRDWSTVTLGEVQSERKYQRNSRVRALARNLYIKSGRPRHCSICQYSVHFEVAHIVDVSKFPEDTMLSVVNSLDNILALCPNHHWEFDNNLL